MTRLETLMEAIAKQEGFYRPGTIPQRTNNPGDLIFAHQRKAIPYPVTGADGKVRVYAAFPTVADGLFALSVQIHLDAGRGETLAQFVNKFAPASDGNDPRSYLGGIMRAMGVTDSSMLLRDVIAEVPCLTA